MTEDRNKPDTKKPRKVVHKLNRSGNVPPIREGQSRASSDDLKFDQQNSAKESTPLVVTRGRFFQLLSLVVLLGIGGYFVWSWTQSNAPTNNEESSSKTNEPSETLEVVEILDFTEDPMEVAESFTAATDPQERLKWVRNPEEVASRMSDYPKQALDEPVMELVDLGVLKRGNAMVAGFGAVFEDGSRRLISVIATEEGSRVDWDSYARYCSASWSDLLGGQVDSAEVRVLAKPVAYYNYDFEDGDAWDGFLLSSPDLDGPVFGYAKEGTKVAEILNSTLPWTDGEGLRMTLRLSAVGDSAEHRQFVIDRVLAYGWVRLEEDLQDMWVSTTPKKEKEE